MKPRQCGTAMLERVKEEEMRRTLTPEEFLAWQAEKDRAYNSLFNKQTQTPAEHRDKQP